MLAVEVVERAVLASIRCARFAPWWMSNVWAVGGTIGSLQIPSNGFVGNRRRATRVQVVRTWSKRHWPVWPI